jgi:hypothetical protein
VERKERGEVTAEHTQLLKLLREEHNALGIFLGEPDSKRLARHIIVPLRNRWERVEKAETEIRRARQESMFGQERE